MVMATHAFKDTGSRRRQEAPCSHAECVAAAMAVLRGCSHIVFWLIKEKMIYWDLGMGNAHVGDQIPQAVTVKTEKYLLLQGSSSIYIS